MVRVGETMIEHDEDPDGAVEILRRPQRGNLYVMGSDVGEGIKEDELIEYRDDESGDITKTYSTCVVLEHETWCNLDVWFIHPPFNTCCMGERV